MCVQLHIDSNSSYPKQKGGLMKNAYFLSRGMMHLHLRNVCRYKLPYIIFVTGYIMLMSLRYIAKRLDMIIHL